MARKARRDEVLLALTRTIAAISVRAAAEAEPSVPPVQLRTLTLLQTLGPVNLAALSEALGRASSATSRLCDRLVAAGLISRAQSPDTRREVVVSITTVGEGVLRRIDDDRVEHLNAIVRRLPRARQSAVLDALAELVQAAENTP